MTHGHHQLLSAIMIFYCHHHKHEAGDSCRQHNRLIKNIMKESHDKQVMCNIARTRLSNSPLLVLSRQGTIRFPIRTICQYSPENNKWQTIIKVQQKRIATKRHANACSSVEVGKYGEACTALPKRTDAC